MNTVIEKYLEHEEQRYGRNKDIAINHRYINSSKYRRKFDRISNDKKLNRLLYKLAKRILLHRTGTLYEDMYWIDPETLQIVASITDSKLESSVVYNKSVIKMLKEYKGLITIHSHPNSMPPSYNDLYCNYYYGYSIGVVVCHDGAVYIYATEEEISETYYKYAAGDFVNEGHSEKEAFRLVLEKLADDGKIQFKEVTIDDI